MFEAIAWALIATLWLACELAAILILVVAELIGLLRRLLGVLWRFLLHVLSRKRLAREMALRGLPEPRRAPPHTTSGPLPPRGLKQ